MKTTIEADLLRATGPADPAEVAAAAARLREGYIRMAGRALAPLRASQAALAAQQAARIREMARAWQPPVVPPRGD
jgi:hypothetical protein